VRLDLEVSSAASLGAARLALLRTVGREPQLDREARRITVEVSGGPQMLTTAMRELDLAQVALVDIALRRPTLDEVFLHLTGHGAGGTEADGLDAQAEVG
jgi:ABC-2 type transport system ATP-binding protein